MGVFAQQVKTHHCDRAVISWQQRVQVQCGIILSHHYFGISSSQAAPPVFDLL